MLWAIGLIGTFYLFTLVLGFGAAALLDTGDRRADVAASKGNLASPLLAEAVGGGAGTTGGAVLLAVIAAVAFATILAVVAGLTLTSSSSVAHDLYNQRVQQGQGHREGGDQGRPDRRLRASARIAIVLAIPAQNLNIAFLVALAFAVAASANLPAIIYNMFWRRFNTRGAMWSIYGGLISSLGLVFFSPVMSGKGVDPTGKSLSLLPASVDFSWFPLENPGIVSIPLGFLLGWLGTVTAKEPEAVEDATTELEVRSLTGAGAEARRPALTGTPARTTPACPTGTPPGGEALPAPVRAPRRRAAGTPRLPTIGSPSTSDRAPHEETRPVSDQSSESPVEPAPRGAPVRPAGRARGATPT